MEEAQSYLRKWADVLLLGLVQMHKGYKPSERKHSEGRCLRVTWQRGSEKGEDIAHAAATLFKLISLRLAYVRLQSRFFFFCWIAAQTLIDCACIEDFTVMAFSDSQAIRVQVKLPEKSHSLWVQCGILQWHHTAESKGKKGAIRVSGETNSQITCERSRCH